MDRLRPLWSFDDLDATEQRFRAQLEREDSGPGRAEVLTQLARVEGLRGSFDRCAALLEEAEPLAGSSAAANVRLELEHGRMLRSSGDRAAALPLFRSAFAHAVQSREHYLAGDAAHMCALAADDRRTMEEWTQRGLDLAEREPDASYWAGPLLNNLGWAYFDDARFDAALEVFERALQARDRDRGNVEGVVWAQYAVGRTLRMLDRPRDALPVLEAAAAGLPSAAEIEEELAACRLATRGER
jgi:tetratricopeptide (TPR) repeat protein